MVQLNPALLHPEHLSTNKMTAGRKKCKQRNINTRRKTQILIITVDADKHWISVTMVVVRR